MQHLEVGQQWEITHTRTKYIAHVLAIFSDKNDKRKVAIQLETPTPPHIHDCFHPAKIVTPSWFYGQTIKTEPASCPQ